MPSDSALAALFDESNLLNLQKFNRFASHVACSHCFYNHFTMGPIWVFEIKTKSFRTWNLSTKFDSGYFYHKLDSIYFYHVSTYQDNTMQSDLSTLGKYHLLSNINHTCLIYKGINTYLGTASDTFQHTSYYRFVSFMFWQNWNCW